MLKLLKLIEAVEIAEQKCNAAWDLYEADCENEKLEAEYDELYAKSWHMQDKLAHELVSFTANKIDLRTAREMAFFNRSKLLAILNK